MPMLTLTRRCSHQEQNMLRADGRLLSSTLSQNLSTRTTWKIPKSAALI